MNRGFPVFFSIIRVLSEVSQLPIALLKLVINIILHDRLTVKLDVNTAAVIECRIQ